MIASYYKSSNNDFTIIQEKSQQERMQLLRQLAQSQLHTLSGLEINSLSLME